MINRPVPGVSRIVLPAASPVTQPLPVIYKPLPYPGPRLQQWAPAWFYSALNWLGKPYYDASNVQQSFNQYMAGSDVDPYARLGSTRLFVITRTSDGLVLSLAADAQSDAPMPGGTFYHNSDEGIVQMYVALSASAIFSSVKYCYIPGRIGSDLNPTPATFAAASALDGLATGYDPVTGLRAVVLGSAVSQIVPLDDFLTTHNEQIYNDSPAIVPVVDALVYDVTQYNELGATTFLLPVFYPRDQVSPQNYYVNKFAAATQVSGVSAECGQTVLFPGGPGYNDAAATALKLDGTAQTVTSGLTFTTYTFDTATVVSTLSTLGSKIQAGAMSLTYSAPSPLSVFAEQRIIGFYRDNKWKTCLGVPIYDYGGQNASFTAATQPLQDPTLIYDPTNPSLNGGSLQSVVHKLLQATYMYSPDRLASILNVAIAARDTEYGAGFAVTTGALEFNPSPASAAGIADHLAVPVAATITTTPPIIQIPKPIGRFNEGLLQIIGGGANNPQPIQLNPVTFQTGLTAFIPQEALSGTGIISVEIGTVFSQQPLGVGATFHAAAAGATLNLLDRHSDTPALAPCDLALATARVKFTAGISYVLSLTGSTLTVRGSDNSSSSSQPVLSAVDPNHTFVGAMVYTAATTSVLLYPKLQLAFAAPAPGTHGIVQGSQYSVRLTLGSANSSYDLTDSTQTAIDSNISIPTPAATDGSKPQPGDMYFGSFLGGSSEVTVWSVPVFLTVSPSLLTGASFDGAMTLDSRASGLPTYQLQITDSSLFVFSNINVDSETIGQVSSSNVYLAGVAINASPDDATSKAFAPCKLLLGLVRQARMGGNLLYVFVPEADSVVIGSTRYMLSVINLGDLNVDPNSRPYPPVQWPSFQYWQFANRHNPYLDVRYTGATQQDRIRQSQTDAARIGLETERAQEPMQLYLDTNSKRMTVWPIFEFPFAATTQSVDQGQFKAINDTILTLLSTTFTQRVQPAVPGALDAERITIPGQLQQDNPYTAGVTDSTASTATSQTSTSTPAFGTSPTGLAVNNLSPGVIANTSIQGIPARQSFELHQAQQATAEFAFAKSIAPVVQITQASSTNATTNASTASRRGYESIYGFSVYNPGTGEAYIVEVVEADLDTPNRLPDPTQNADYDPFYVRVVFLNTLTCYNMSIIVPAMAHDQYGYLGTQETSYQNVLSKTDELTIGYLYSFYDSANNFDTLDFLPFDLYAERVQFESERYLFTNLPYRAKQTTSFDPSSLFAKFVATNAAADRKAVFFDTSSIVYKRSRTPPEYFICRRLNWSADCHLMQATHPAGMSIYLAFGAGDIVPFRLDIPFTPNKQLPAHMHKLTYSFADQKYDEAKAISVGNTPYFVAVTTLDNVTSYTNFSINATAGTADLQIGTPQKLIFPTECYVVGQASTTLTPVANLDPTTTTTGDFMNPSADPTTPAAQPFQVIPYNNLVYLIRAVSNIPALSALGGLNVTSGLLVDTFVPKTTGYLTLAQAARYKRSGLSYFGNSYTPTTMVDSLDTLDFTSITGDTFYVPTIFIPIPEIDATQSFIADLSNFLGQQIWTFIYSELFAQPGAPVNGQPSLNGLNIDSEGKPILSLQKLHFVYDPLVVMFTPNDLTHKYPLQPKQQILALTNGQIEEGICWRSGNVQLDRRPPTNVCAQQILPPGFGMDRPNIVYSPHNRPISTWSQSGYRGMSVNSIRSLGGVVYNIEETNLSGSIDQTGSGFISAVSTVSNMLIGVLFDYDNNDLGDLPPSDPDASSKGVVFLNGYLGATGYVFSSPDHFDVNDVLPSQLPLLEQIADIFGHDVAFYDTDVSLPRQFWSFSYDTLTAFGLSNYISNVPPSAADPNFTNRTRSLLLSIQNPVRPQEIGLMDTYSSVVSANLHLQNGVTGSIFLNKKADRDVASLGTNPAPPASFPLLGLPAKYDFYLFSRDHYSTLFDSQFNLIDQGYAMCLVDDGSGTGTKIASFYLDSEGDYNELYTYVLTNASGSIIESSSFTLKVTLGAPANLSATPILPETPNNVNPQDLVTQINKVSNLIYAAMGPSTPGLAPAFLPIQVAGAPGIAASPLLGPPGFNGYNLNVGSANRQPVQISQIYSGAVTYAIAGSTTSVPVNPKTGKPVPFYGSISHGLDMQNPAAQLQSVDGQSFLPRPATQTPPVLYKPLYGGDGLGSLIGTNFSAAFQGSGAIPPAIASDPTPGTVMKPDDTVFYTYNAVTNTIMDSTGHAASLTGSQYFVDETDPLNPIYAVITLPKFTFNGNTYTVNLSTTLPDGSQRYTLIAGDSSFLFAPDNAHVIVDNTVFTFNKVDPATGAYTVTYTAADAPADASAGEAPSPILLTPFSVAAGGTPVATLDVFTLPGSLSDFVLGVIGRQYNYDPVHATVTVTQGATITNAPIQTGMTFVSNSNYGYVIGFDGKSYTANGSPMFPYHAVPSGAAASYSLLTRPQMFTIGGNFYTFDQDGIGNYVSVTGNSQTYPVNPYQFSINGAVYILNTSVQPNTVVGGGNIYTMTAANSQFLISGVQYTIALKQNSLNGATISGQFNITQGNVVVVENYVYQLDTLNGQIVGNGTVYPLTTSGFTYTITTADRSFTVTTEPNATTVTIGGVVYEIGNTIVTGDGITYPILVYRTFLDGTEKFNIGLDGVVYVPPPFTLSGTAPWTRSTFTDTATYTVNDLAAFDGTTYFLISGSPAQFKTSTLTYTVRTDGVAITAGAKKTYIVPFTGPLSPNEFPLGTKKIFFGRPSDIAAFDGTTYFPVANNEFTAGGATYTLSGNTAVHEGNSYEIFSNLGQGDYFELPDGTTYYVNMTVADFGTPSGDIFSVFPISGGQFTIPIDYTIALAGVTATVSSAFAAPIDVPTLIVSSGALTGGNFTDPLTGITYTCAVESGKVTFTDSNNAVYPYPAPGTTDSLVVNVVVATAANLAVDSETTPAVYPVFNNQFLVGATTYAVNVPVAYQNAATGPYWPIVDGRFIIPRTDPLSSIAYTLRGSSVTKGYVISNDDEFSIDGNVVYTVNEVNVVRATNQATLSGAEPSQTLVAGALTYALDSATSIATLKPAGLNYNTVSKEFTVSYNGLDVIYTVGSNSVIDNRQPANTFPATLAGSTLTFTDTISGVTFTFDDSGNNPITAEFVYENHFFIDTIAGVTYYIDVADTRVEAISYLPETTQYAFTPADGNTYLIHYSNVGVVFPVIAGANVDAGVATVGSDIFTINIDEVDPASGAAGILINQNSFEINGNLYTITGTPVGPDYSACHVVGDATAAMPFLSPNTFKLTDPTVTYKLQLDSANLPTAVVATFQVRPSRDLVTVNDDVYLITYNTVSTGSLLGQGNASIPIANSSFTLKNPFDATKATFIFDDLNIYDAASVVGQFTAYLAPTFFIDNTTYTLDPVNLIVTDNDKRPFPLLPNPTMFSINGFNYVIDSNRTPHAIIGNNNVSPLSTDVTVESGRPSPNSTFTLNGQIYKYTEDALHNLLTITGTKSYMLAQPALTFKLDSSLLFTVKLGAPGSFPGTTAPIGTVTSAGSPTLNLYKGVPESGNADFFMYKNVLYTFVKSGAGYLAVQKSYTVYVAKPAPTQQQLAVFDLNGTTYIATDGPTAGSAAPAGINAGSMWSQTSPSTSEVQFGLVYGFTPQPISVTLSTKNIFQFLVPGPNASSTLYDITYAPGSNTNTVHVDVPDSLPTFVQTASFNFPAPSSPLTLETGGYNAFTTSVAESATPSVSFAAAYKTPILSTDSRIDQLITAQGDFSLEFWHSIPVTTNLPPYHPFTYSASTSIPPLVYYLDIDFETDSSVYLAINETVLSTKTNPPVFSSGWRHIALTYTQPYMMLCMGEGFEVKQANNYNFSRDFSIALTFCVNDATTNQGLIYKGTGSNNTSPDLSMSYRVAVNNNGALTLTLTDGTGAISPEIVGPTISAGAWYQAIIVKQTVMPSTTQDPSKPTDPYLPPFGSGELDSAQKGGGSASTSGFSNGSISLTNLGPASPSTNLDSFLKSIKTQPPKSYSVTISVRTVNDDGSYGIPWAYTNQVLPLTPDPNASDAILMVNNTGPAHLLIGAAYDDSGQPMPLGSILNPANIRDVYLFNGAINPEGVMTGNGLVNLADASSQDLVRAGIMGYWKAQYDPNGVVNNPYDQNAAAVSTSSVLAKLAPMPGREYEATKLYINGYEMQLSYASRPSSMSSWAGGSSSLTFNAGLYKLQEICLWSMTRQPYQVIDDMFGRIVYTNEPNLVIYLGGSFPVKDITPPILPLNQYIDHIPVTNAIVANNLIFSNASLDLSGCPAIARCGPLITANLYTPPGVALTVCDTVPQLTTYSVTLNTLTGTLAGEINEAYVYVQNNVLTLYAGKKVGDLTLTWVSQEQGDVQLIGYIEGAPPCPMANLTNKPATTFLENTTVYAGATSVSFTAPTSLTLKYQQDSNFTHETKWKIVDLILGAKGKIALNISPFGVGLHSDALNIGISSNLAPIFTTVSSTGQNWKQTSTNKLDESNKYTVKMQGTLSSYTGDPFMGSLNTLTTPSNTPGNPSSKAAILPNPNLGGFTTSNPPAALPKTAPTDEKFGARMYVPSPYGQAYVTSKTLDVYQQTLVQTNTVYGFVKIPDAQIPRDINIVSFRMSSKYIRPGCLDGVVGYVYNPATLPTGAQTYTTSTGQMEPLYDLNFAPGEVGHEASYMRVVEAYKLKKQIDQQAFNALALYQSAYNTTSSPTDATLTPALDFYNEYVWSSRGGTQEVKHTYATTFDEVYTVTSGNSLSTSMKFHLKVYVFSVTVLNLKFTWTDTTRSTIRYSYDTSSTSSFDINASFDGIETDTQMRYSCNNDAHFVMNFNSTFNPNNQSGLNLVIGSDGLVYKIVPSVSSGAGIPLSDNIDDSQTYSQPQPAYTAGNADGLTGNLEPYDRPGKTNLFRSYAFFLQPAKQNSDDFWNTVIDQVWLNNSPDADADAMRSAQQHPSMPWRLLYRVTYSERFLPPISNAAVVIPQITPIMAVPVLNAASDFLFTDPGKLPSPASNPANDIEANIVLAAPTASGLSAGSSAKTLPNNVIPFDLVKGPASLVNWGDTANTTLLTQLLASVLGVNTVSMSTQVLAGSTKVRDILNPIGGGILYTIYTDPNGLTVNVPTDSSITVYQDVNSNPIQFYDGKAYHSLQADYIPSPDGTIMYYIEPPSNYDQSSFNLLGDYDLYGNPGDQWRYYLVSGFSANMTSEPGVIGNGPFLISTGATPYTGFSVALPPYAKSGPNKVQGYVLVQGILQWPHLNTTAETFADLLVYKAMSLLDTFPIGDPEVLVAFLEYQYPNAFLQPNPPTTTPVYNGDIELVFARNIISYFNAAQKALLP